MAWLQERLDKSHLNNKPAENLDITRAVNYHVDVGLTVQFIRAYGLAGKSHSMYHGFSISFTELGFITVKWCLIIQGSLLPICPSNYIARVALVKLEIYGVR